MIRICDLERVIEPPGNRQRLDARRPFVAIAKQQQRLLRLFGAKTKIRTPLIVILVQITGGGIVVNRLKKNRVVRRDVPFQLGGNRELVLIVVGALAIVGTVKGVHRIAEVVKRPVLRAGLNPGAAAQILGARSDAKPVVLKQLGILLLRNILRECAGADGRQEIGQQIFAQPRRFIAQIDLVGVAKLVVAVGQEKVGRIIRVIVVHGARGFAHGHVIHAGIAVNACQICAAHGLILVEQHPRAVNRPVVVKFLGFFQIANRLVDTVLLLVQQRGVKPAGRVIRIELAGQLKFVVGARVIARLAESLAQVTAEDGAIRFQGGSDLQVFTAGFGFSPANAAQTTAEPGIAQRTINGYRLVKLLQRVANPVLRGQKKPFQGNRLRIAGGKGEAFV